MSSIGHNSGNADQALRQYVDRIERLQCEKKALQDDIASVYAEVKSAGFDRKVLRRLIAERARKPQEVAEENEILELYRGIVNGSDRAPCASMGG